MSTSTRVSYASLVENQGPMPLAKGLIASTVIRLRVQAVPAGPSPSPNNLCSKLYPRPDLPICPFRSTLPQAHEIIYGFTIGIICVFWQLAGIRRFVRFAQTAHAQNRNLVGG